jgi:hypothetical protein
MLMSVSDPFNDFVDLARYLVLGKAGTTPDPKRVAWISANPIGHDGWRR